MPNSLCDHAKDIWRAAIDAVRPDLLIAKALGDEAMQRELHRARRILGAGRRQGGGRHERRRRAMPCRRAEQNCRHRQCPGRIGTAPEAHPLARRPPGRQQSSDPGRRGRDRGNPETGREAGPDDVALCLISGGGSALLPAPAAGVTLADKQAVTKLLHACGATINEMNAVRKHLSAFKGGRLAQVFAGRALYSLIISDVIGDPLDVIASGPTAADPSTFGDALAVLDRWRVAGGGRVTNIPPPTTHHPPPVPAAVIEHLQRGARGELTETPKLCRATFTTSSSATTFRPWPPPTIGPASGIRGP